MTEFVIFNVMTFQVKYEKLIDWVVDIRNTAFARNVEQFTLLRGVVLEIVRHVLSCSYD